CLHQCGNKRLCRLGVTPSISTLGSQMSEAPFCLYAACLLIEILHTGHSRLIPHQWKGCLGPVCTLSRGSVLGSPHAGRLSVCRLSKQSLINSSRDHFDESTDEGKERAWDA